MAKTVEEIEREIRSLSDDERIHLLRDLVADLDGGRDPEVEKAWLEEVHPSIGTPIDKVFRRAVLVRFPFSII